MVHRLLILFSAILTFSSYAKTTYYVSAEKGSNINNGSISRPFKTIQRAVDAVQAGDTIIVKAGIYRETIRSKRNGSKAKPIRIKAASGEKVILTATNPINPKSWVKHRNNIYKAPFRKQAYALYAFDEHLAKFDFDQTNSNIVKELMIEARFPNKPSTDFTIFETIENSNYTPISRSGKNFTVAALPKGQDYSNTKLYSYSSSKGTRWWSMCSEILSSNGNVLQGKTDTGWLSNSTKGYISGHLAFLDSEKEWFSNAKALYFNALGNVNPNTLHIEAKTRHYALEITHDHIWLDGFKIFSGAIFIGGNSNVIRRCYLRHPNHHLVHNFGHSQQSKPQGNALSAIHLAGHNNILHSINVSYTAADAISMAGNWNRIENSSFNYTSYLGHYAHTITISGHDNIVIGNTMIHGGKSHIRLHHTYDKLGINTGSKRFRILYNDLSQNAYVAHDVGIVVGWGIHAEKGEIAYNWIHNNLSSTNNSKLNHAIYLDNNMREILIHHNVCWNVKGSNLRMNSPAFDIFVYNNTFGKSGELFGNNVYYNPDIKELNSNRKIANGYFDLFVANNYLLQPIRYKKGYGHKAAKNNIINGDSSAFSPPTFQITNSSPAVNKGTPLSYINRNIRDKEVDVGAYEAGAKVWKPGVNRIEAHRTPILKMKVPDLKLFKKQALERLSK